MTPAQVIAIALCGWAMMAPDARAEKTPPSSEAAAPETGASTGGGWREVAHATFDVLDFVTPPVWRRDVPADTAHELPADARRFADDGAFFAGRHAGFSAPVAYRLSAPLGPGGFLTLEAYARDQKALDTLCAVVDDPARPGHRVLRLASPEHTDAVILRTTQPLGARYHICAHVGFIDFGTGEGVNGYRGDERNGPWLSGTATDENGCYLGAIYRAVPRPHNNVLAHHLRIAFIDTDNNTGNWTQLWDPQTRRFISSGWHPLVMAVVDGRGIEQDEDGPPFTAFAGGRWNAPGEIDAVDAYKERTWYTVCITRFDDRLTLQISGDFRFGGQTAYAATCTDASRAFHFEDPHYWLLGDPHINYYAGRVLVDDVVLQRWEE